MAYDSNNKPYSQGGLKLLDLKIEAYSFLKNFHAELCTPGGGQIVEGYIVTSAVEGYTCGKDTGMVGKFGLGDED